MKEYLARTRYFDFDHPDLKAYANRLCQNMKSDREKAVALYYGVRDDIRYNPYVFSSAPQSFSASYCLAKRESYCIPKAVLLGALCRGVGIPSRLGLADVKNHLSSPQLIEYLQSEVFVMHGYIELFLEGRWVKATPAFNKRLCRLMKVEPLEFDGKQDSIFHEYGQDGSRHMEYLADHGQFADVPLDFIINSIRQAYPHLAHEKEQLEFQHNSLLDDVQSPNSPG